MKTNIALRPATQEDYGFLLDLRNKTMNHHIENAGLTPTEELHRERIHYGFDAAQIITVENTPIGLIKMVREPSLWTLVQIQLKPEYQGKGIGGKLIRQLLDEATINDAAVILSVYKCNPARYLYQRLGFYVYRETEKTFEMRWDKPSHN